MTWFDEARLGMFVHWDHASQQGLELSWPLVGGVFALPFGQQVSAEQYHTSASSFDPVDWDPGALARTAKASGMGYAVLTAKHHSGFALWPTAWSTHSVASSGHGSDLVASFVDAVRAEGLRVGLYMSLSDWHHPDYPAWRDEYRPYRIGHSPPRPSPEAWQRYLCCLQGQVAELLTNYGPIDLIWFDGGWERSAEEWRAAELEGLIRELQPNIMINDRLPGATADFVTPEQFVPEKTPAQPWETCLTMNDSWGYVPDDTNYKSATELIQTIVEVAGRGGNLLLNVSPTGSGTIPSEQTERLAAIADWMGSNREAVTGTSPGLEPWQWYGPSTQRPGLVYLHLLGRPHGDVVVRGINVRRVVEVRTLARQTLLTHTIRTGVLESLSPDPTGELRIAVPSEEVDGPVTVLVLSLADHPVTEPTASLPG